jgi:hypothetical protein
VGTTAILSAPTPPIPAEIPGLEVTVAYRPAGSGFYGEDRLRALIASRADSAATTTDAVLDDVLAFQSAP